MRLLIRMESNEFGKNPKCGVDWDFPKADNIEVDFVASVEQTIL